MDRRGPAACAMTANSTPSQPPPALLRSARGGADRASPPLFACEAERFVCVATLGRGASQLEPSFACEGGQGGCERSECSKPTRAAVTRTIIASSPKRRQTRTAQASLNPTSLAKGGRGDASAASAASPPARSSPEPTWRHRQNGDRPARRKPAEPHFACEGGRGDASAASAASPPARPSPEPSWRHRQNGDRPTRRKPTEPHFACEGGQGGCERSECRVPFQPHRNRQR
jgi:hypothetical protein